MSGDRDFQLERNRVRPWDGGRKPQPHLLLGPRPAQMPPWLLIPPEVPRLRSLSLAMVARKRAEQLQSHGGPRKGRVPG